MTYLTSVLRFLNDSRICRIRQYLVNTVFDLTEFVKLIWPKNWCLRLHFFCIHTTRLEQYVWDVLNVLFEFFPQKMAAAGCHSP